MTGERCAKTAVKWLALCTLASCPAPLGGPDAGDSSGGGAAGGGAAGGSSAGGAAGGAPGGGASAGGAAGGRVDAGSADSGIETLVVLGPDASVGLVLFDRFDAGVTLSAADGFPPTDPQAGWRFLPEGLSFDTPAFFGRRLSQPRSPDAGVTLWMTAVVSADGGAEVVPTTTEWTLDGPETATGWEFAAVPHFSVSRSTPVGQLNLGVTPDRTAYLTGTVFYASGVITSRADQSLQGTLLVTATGALGSFREPGIPIEARSTGLGANVRCERSGNGRVIVTAVITRISWLDGGVVSATPQTVALDKSVFCLDPDAPVSEPPPPAGVFPVRPVPLFNPLSPPMEVAAERLADALSGREPTRLGDSLRGTIALPCGVRGLPCALDTPYGAVARVTSTAGSIIRVFGPTVSGANGGIFGELVIRPSGQGDFDFYGPLRPDPFELAASTTTILPFEFKCLHEGVHEMTLSGRLELGPVDTKRSGFVLARARVRCGGKGDAIMLSDNTRLTRSGTTWNAQPTGVTANLIVATDSVRASFSQLSAETVAYDGVTSFQSVVGFPRVRFQSSRQTAVFTHTGTRYVQSGLVGGPAYATTDSLTITGLLQDGGVGLFADGGAATLTVVAPPGLPPPSQLFGTRAGLETEVRLPEGSFDVLFVSCSGASRDGGEGGLFRTVPASSMTLDGGIRTAPLLAPEDVRALASWGVAPTTVYVAAYRQLEASDWFFTPDGGPLSVPVQAGRMVQVSTADLGP